MTPSVMSRCILWCNLERRPPAFQIFGPCREARLLAVCRRARGGCNVMLPRGCCADGTPLQAANVVACPSNLTSRPAVHLRVLARQHAHRQCLAHPPIIAMSPRSGDSPLGAACLRSRTFKSVVCRHLAVAGRQARMAVGRLVVWCHLAAAGRPLAPRPATLCPQVAIVNQKADAVEHNGHQAVTMSSPCRPSSTDRQLAMTPMDRLAVVRITSHKRIRRKRKSTMGNRVRVVVSMGCQMATCLKATSRRSSWVATRIRELSRPLVLDASSYRKPLFFLGSSPETAGHQHFSWH